MPPGTRFVRPPISNPPANAALLTPLLERLATQPDSPNKTAAQSLLASSEWRSILCGVMNWSPHLKKILLGEPELIGRCQEPAAQIDGMIAAINGYPLDHRPSLLRALRLQKQRLAAVIALADLANRFTLEQTTAALTAAADLAIAKLVDHLLLAAQARGEIKLIEPEHPSLECGVIVLAMGKHGAFELNYSSDVDLIILFDPHITDQRACANPVALAVHLARTLTHALEQKTADGYIYRADLRLRPNLPGNPLAIATDQAEAYYEQQGQNWERAAFIKARPIAGDLTAGRQFLERLAPFLWRKHLDYAAIKDIQSIKRQINAHHGFGTVNVRGHDLKVGRGGIREIEFFCQTQQLILGGRAPELRLSGTCAALDALHQARWLDAEPAADLTAAYGDLRDLEHRLQMLEDRQTHRLPERDDAFAQFAQFCGHSDIESFSAGISSILRRVEARYSALFETAPDLGAGGHLVFTGTSDDPATLQTLSDMGFVQTEHISATIRGWHRGEIRAARSTRARELLTELTPALLTSLQAQNDQDRAFALFDELLRSLPSGVQLFSLFHANPKLLELVSNLIGAAPKLVRLLASSTDMFEALLTPDFFDTLPNQAELAREHQARLGDARDLQDVFDLSRQWAHGRQFQAGMQVFLGIAPIQTAARTLTTIAELMIQRMLAEAEQWLCEQHGTIPGGRFMVLGLGKLGSGELTMGSDLDLVFIFDANIDLLSDGAKPLPCPTYYARLGQRLITALSARTAEGRLYEIDTRLRPSGNAGPVACALSNFAGYQEKTAETWERQALTRARPVAGEPALSESVMAVINASLMTRRDPVTLAQDVRAMRERIFKEHGSDTPWHLKHARGGLVEVEFTAQLVQLIYACDHPNVRTQATREIFAAANEARVLASDDAQTLIDALDLMHALTGVFRLSQIEKFAPEDASEGLRDALVRAAEQAMPGRPIGSFATLDGLLVETQNRVRHIFDRLAPANATA